MKNENNTQHTEGKWIVTGQDKNHVSVGTGHFIADCSVFKRAGLMLLLEEQQANAKLIVRAPELLKENEQLKREVETERQITDNFQKLAVDRLRMYSQSEAENKRVQALNAELLACLKGMTEEFSNLLDVPHNYKELEGWPGDENPKLVIWNRSIQAIERATK